MNGKVTGRIDVGAIDGLDFRAKERAMKSVVT
jgi:hypothetical protein